MLKICSHIWIRKNPIKAFFLYLLVYPIAVVVGLLLLPIALVWYIYLTIKYR